MLTRKCMSIKGITRLFFVGLIGFLMVQMDIFRSTIIRASLLNPWRYRSDFSKNTVWSSPIGGPRKQEVHRLLGNPRSTVGFLTVGLCTVPRQESYLIQTLTALGSRMTVHEKNTTTVVVFLSSDNATWTQATLSKLSTAFAEDIKMGLMHVIQPDPSIYPNFSNITKRTFGDDLKRVHWRTKQNIDYAYLFSYCSNISQYYIHIEDDVLAQPGLIPVIRDSIHRHRNTIWFCMDFSGMGFIGKLFRSSDLQLIKTFLLMFKAEQPGDWLVTYLYQIMTQKKVVKGTKTLFKHIGKVSSLKGKIHDLKHSESYMEHEEFLLQNTNATINPDGVFETSIETNAKFKPELAYRNQTDMHSFFWGKTPKRGDYFKIILTQPANVSEILIISGHPVSNKDIIKGAEVHVSNALDYKGKCVRGQKVGKFDPHGSIQASFTKPVLTKCVAIIFTQPSRTWVIIRHFRITVKPDYNEAQGTSKIALLKPNFVINGK